MFNVAPASLVCAHSGASQRGPAIEYWQKAYSQYYSPDGSSGMTLFDDFKNFGMTATISSNVGRYASTSGAFLSYEDTGDAITQIATDVNGAMKLATDNSDNDEVWIQPGMATSVSSVVSTTDGENKLVIFGCRVKVSSVADSTINWFVGLTEEGLAAADTISDSGAFASKDMIGFWVSEADGDSVKFGYRKAGQALQTVGSHAFAADTYTQLGFIYDPQAVAARKIRFFINSTEKATYVTATDIAAATFPNGEELQPLFGIKNGTTTAIDMTVDWYGLHFGA